jgi:hypothetical protein
MSVTRYDPADQPRWDSFIAVSKNGTFLLNRGYMDYHRDRFSDHSLLVYDAKGSLLAVLPGNQEGETLFSHGGLTYGGLICGSSMTAPVMLAIFNEILEYLLGHGIRRLVYKTIPHIYHRQPAEEDRYALFRAGARLYRRDVLSVIVLSERLPLQKRRQRKVARANSLGLRIQVAGEFSDFWSILAENLALAHDTKPVHTLSEIQWLFDRFPENIRLHVCMEGDDVIAGAVIFDSGRVAHVQYNAATPRGREAGALDLLFATLIEGDYEKRHYFDFGISNENEGRYLNVGLVEQKEGFGARTVVHDFYQLDF